MKNVLVKTPLFKRQEAEGQILNNRLWKSFGVSGALLSNGELQEGKGVRAHRPLAVADLPPLPSSIRTVRSYEETLLLFCQDETTGFYEIYTLKEGVLTKTSTSVATYPNTSDGSDYCNSMVATVDESAAIDQGCAHTKLLFFPSRQVACLGEDGLPMVYTAMPSDVPKFKHATTAKGRLYGSVGQKLYVSGDQGCFDWFFDDSENGNLSFNAAWSGGSMTVSEGGLPITALCSFKDRVLVFRKNAMQAIEGDGAPFIIKDLFKTGTASSKSVKEVEGKLYFISENRVVCYNGTGITFLPELPEGTVLPGAAGVFEGCYCFYAEKEGAHFVYTYHPALDSYSVTRSPRAIKEFVSCGKTLYALAEEFGGKSALYAFDRNRSAVYMQASIPIVPSEHGAFLVDKLCLRTKFYSAGTIYLSAEIVDARGEISYQNLGSFEGEAGKEYSFAVKKRIKSGYKARLNLECGGDILLEGYEVKYRKKEIRSTCI